MAGQYHHTRYSTGIDGYVHYGHDDVRIRHPDDQSTRDSLHVHADAVLVREGAIWYCSGNSGCKYTANCNSKVAHANSSLLRLSKTFSRIDRSEGV